MAYPYEKPFNLHFITGNSSKCEGCKGKYVKPAVLPFNLCIQHEEWRQNTFGSSPAPSSVFSNAYYHPSLHCLSVNWPGFRGEHLVIPEGIKSALTESTRFFWNKNSESTLNFHISFFVVVVRTQSLPLTFTSLFCCCRTQSLPLTVTSLFMLL